MGTARPAPWASSPLRLYDPRNTAGIGAGDGWAPGTQTLTSHAGNWAEELKAGRGKHIIWTFHVDLDLRSELESRGSRCPSWDAVAGMARATRELGFQPGACALGDEREQGPAEWQWAWGRGDVGTWGGWAVPAVRWRA